MYYWTMGSIVEEAKSLEAVSRSIAWMHLHMHTCVYLFACMPIVYYNIRIRLY